MEIINNETLNRLSAHIEPYLQDVRNLQVYVEKNVGTEKSVILLLRDNARGARAQFVAELLRLHPMQAVMSAHAFEQSLDLSEFDRLAESVRAHEINPVLAFAFTDKENFNSDFVRGVLVKYCTKVIDAETVFRRETAETILGLLSAAKCRLSDLLEETQGGDYRLARKLEY